MSISEEEGLRMPMTSTAIRQHFLDFFESKGHKIVSSAPIVVKNDPTLLFTNAGMNQFKDYFLGNSIAENKRVVDTQKCLRVSGKHNDLEEVGVDNYHHTMFEMLGNWSFGDYFKKEAIAWAWELLTKVYGMDKSRLYVTVFGGDEKDGLQEDTEALHEWEKWVPQDQILYGNKKNNFWEMGDTGPCGPCSEIHVDCRDDDKIKLIPGRELVNKDDPEVIEIWNIVFMQYNRLQDGSLVSLPACHVDTGMGFERLVRILNHAKSNYDTDIFIPLIHKIETISKLKYEGRDDKKDIAFRVISDHLRAIAFSIADGQLPSNTGAGYVIRRILRRAVRYAYSYLNYKEPLLYQLLEVLAEQFKQVFPELYKQKGIVEKVIREEEESFLRTLGKGMERLEKVLQQKNDHDNNDETIRNKAIKGTIAFELYDTFGFPIDLTKLIASEQGFTVDMEGFEKCLKEQKDRSRAATTIEAQDWIILDKNTECKFSGYETLEADSRIIKYRSVLSGKKKNYQIVLSNTPFYAESGGQQGDTGILTIGEETIRVIDTKKENNLIVHFTDKLPRQPELPVHCKVNTLRRQNAAVHHSATHLLDSALRTVLGKHVAQKGSLVTDQELRFDFTHFSKMTEEEIEKTEKLVNEKIRENINVGVEEIEKEKAIARGAIALFGEKYGEFVRVITIDPAFSVELCGGTHVKATGEIGIFKIKKETAIAAGVRRIEAVAGPAAETYIKEEIDKVKKIEQILKTSKDPVLNIQKLTEENSRLKKQIEELRDSKLKHTAEILLNEVQEIDLKGNRTSLISKVLSEETESVEDLQKICFDLKNSGKLPASYLILLSGDFNGKAGVCIMISETLVNIGINAEMLIKKEIAPLIKGGGGGQKTLASAGGKNTSALNKIKDLLIEKINES